MSTIEHHACGAKLINIQNEPAMQPEIAEGVGISGLIECGGKIIIEKDVFSGHDITILTSKHDYNQFGENRKRYSIARHVHIKEGAWLGSRCIILQGVTIGKHAVVGAGAVVTHDVPDYTLVGGNPAKVIKEIPHD